MTTVEIISATDYSRTLPNEYAAQANIPLK